MAQQLAIGGDPSGDYRARDVGIDGGAASAEEAAIHIIADDAGPLGEFDNLKQPLP